MSHSTTRRNERTSNGIPRNALRCQNRELMTPAGFRGAKEVRDRLVEIDLTAGMVETDRTVEMVVADPTVEKDLTVKTGLAVETDTEMGTDRTAETDRVTDRTVKMDVTERTIEDDLTALIAGLMLVIEIDPTAETGLIAGLDLAAKKSLILRRTAVR